MFCFKTPLRLRRTIFSSTRLITLGQHCYMDANRTRGNSMHILYCVHSLERTLAWMSCNTWMSEAASLQMLFVTRSKGKPGLTVLVQLTEIIDSPPFNREAHCVAFGFMMQVSVRLLNLQQYMIEPNGIPFVLHTLESLSSEYDNCKDELSRDSTQAQITEWWYNVKKAAQYPWNSKLLLQCDFAAFLNRLRYD